jgi:hypothetical protein
MTTDMVTVPFSNVSIGELTMPRTVAILEYRARRVFRQPPCAEVLAKLEYRVDLCRTCETVCATRSGDVIQYVAPRVRHAMHMNVDAYTQSLRFQSQLHIRGSSTLSLLYGSVAESMIVTNFAME